MGSLGGVGAYADLVIQNSATLNVGLFGAHFDVDLDNLAQAGFKLLPLDFKLFKAELRFKATATAKPS